MPPISFNSIPSGTLVPFTSVEFDASRAQQGPAVKPFRGLVIGQRTSAGTVAQLTKTLVTSADQAGEFFGRGSMLHGMAISLFEANKLFAWDFVALDDASGTAATHTFTFTGTATAAGTIYAYVAGRRFSIGVSVGDTANDIATAVAAEINLDDTIPATAGAATSVVTLTARHDGTLGDDIDLRVNYFEGEALPAGVTVAIANPVSGATDPSNFSSVWGILGDVTYDAIVSPYRTAAELLSLETEIEDRRGPVRQLGGYGFVCSRDTHSNTVSLGNGRNAKFVSIMGTEGAPQPTWEWAASIAGVASASAQVDPARPFQTLVLPKILPPSETDIFTVQEQRLLLNDGIATYAVNADGTVAIQRLISTFQTNALGAPDTSYLDANTAFTLDFLQYDLRRRINSTFPRHKLANDGTNFGAGQAIVTPSIMRAFIVGIFSEWEFAGLVEGLDQFKRDLIVERNTDPNRLDILAPPDLVNQLRQTAIQIGFLL